MPISRGAVAADPAIMPGGRSKVQFPGFWVLNLLRERLIIEFSRP
jgi:hypothetical protein